MTNEALMEEVARLREGLKQVIRNEGGCQQENRRLKLKPCREKFPTAPDAWCGACVAHATLGPEPWRLPWET